MTIMRSGGGPARRAEFSVFELVDEGRRLARLHKQTLQNDYGTWVTQSLGKGRFLITIGEIPGGGDTENCLVIYDFVRKTSIAWKQEDFIPADIRERLKGEGVTKGLGWYSGFSWVDSDRVLYYPNDADECREHGFPFLIVDLRGPTVQLVPVPDHVTHDAERPGPGWVSWRWSMGNASEPAWDVPSILPTYLLAVVDQKHYPVNDLAAVGLAEGEASLVKDRMDDVVLGWQTCFKLDAATGDYVRCAVSEWVERSEK